jgi:hypothetical protein
MAKDMPATLNWIALEQAKAMAAKDTLAHEVLRSFSSRIAPARSGRAAENIAYGYDSFERTLDQWIASTGHRKNLLLHNVSRVDVAQQALFLTARIGQWRSRANISRCRQLQARERRLQQKRKLPVQSCRARILGIGFNPPRRRGRKTGTNDVRADQRCPAAAKPSGDNPSGHREATERDFE